MKKFNPDIKFDMKDELYTVLQIFKKMLRKGVILMNNLTIYKKAFIDTFEKKSCIRQIEI